VNLREGDASARVYRRVRCGSLVELRFLGSRGSPGITISKWRERIASHRAKKRASAVVKREGIEACALAPSEGRYVVRPYEN